MHCDWVQGSSFYYVPDGSKTPQTVTLNFTGEDGMALSTSDPPF